jgi:RNA polymerase sigma-70 factor (ECF subfamily)
MMSVWLAAMSNAATAGDDRAAVARMASGDTDGLTSLYDRHGRLVYSLALRIVRDHGDAEDITQEVFVQVWRQADRFDVTRGSVAAWLLTVARARAIDLLRRRRARPQPPGASGIVDTSDLAPGQDVRLEWSERADAVRAALDALPLRQRLMIELAFFEGLTHNEIAEQLEIPLGTVKTRVRQGLMRLRDMLAGAAS